MVRIYIKRKSHSEGMTVYMSASCMSHNSMMPVFLIYAASSGNGGKNKAALVLIFLYKHRLVISRKQSGNSHIYMIRIYCFLVTETVKLRAVCTLQLTGISCYML